MRYDAPDGSGASTAFRGIHWDTSHADSMVPEGSAGRRRADRMVWVVLLLGCVARRTTTTDAFVPSPRGFHLPQSSVATGLAEQSGSNDRIVKRNDAFLFSDGSIPANLRRKIQAKRPPLGHVVPRDFRQRVKQQQQQGGSSSPRLRQQGQKQSDMASPALLKIAGGVARGRRLESPSVYLRPMMGKVKEAVYSTLTSFGLYEAGRANTGSQTSRTHHLDLFAGSGSVGLESLSRGAASCTFVDLAPDCCDCIRRNLAKCQLQERGTVVQADVMLALTNPESVGISNTKTFQLITIAPPYEEVVYGDLIEAVINSPLVAEDTFIMIEYPVELGCLPHVIRREDGGAVIGVRNRRYGRTVIAIYVVKPTGKFEMADSRPEEFVELK